jgi:hypothetical protein
MPANIGPKHDGHAVDVNAEAQYSHRAADALGAGAPHAGQLSDETMVLPSDERRAAYDDKPHSRLRRGDI